MAAHGAAETRPGVRPERDVDHAGLVLERQEDGALGGHRVLARDDQSADLHPTGPRVDQRAVGRYAQSIQRRAEQLDDLAAGVERQDGVGITQAFELGWWR